MTVFISRSAPLSINRRTTSNLLPSEASIRADHIRRRRCALMSAAPYSRSSTIVRRPHFAAAISGVEPQCPGSRTVERCFAVLVEEIMERPGIIDPDRPEKPHDLAPSFGPVGRFTSMRKRRSAIQGSLKRGQQRVQWGMYYVK